MDFLRDSACAVITWNSECSADFGEARGMTHVHVTAVLSAFKSGSYGRSNQGSLQSFVSNRIWIPHVDTYIKTTLFSTVC